MGNTPSSIASPTPSQAIALPCITDEPARTHPRKPRQAQRQGKETKMDHDKTEGEDDEDSGLDEVTSSQQSKKVDMCLIVFVYCSPILSICSARHRHKTTQK
jgi:hypothetical protein